MKNKQESSLLDRNWFTVLIVVAFVVASVWVYNTTFNIPEVTKNPHGEIVKIEAGGKVYTKATDKNFDERVKTIKKNGTYDTKYTGRLDGKP